MRERKMRHKTADIHYLEVCVNENVPHFPASVVLCCIFHFSHFQSPHNDSKRSKNSEEGRTAPALVTPAAGESILKPWFRCLQPCAAAVFAT